MKCQECGKELNLQLIREGKNGSKSFKYECECGKIGYMHKIKSGISGGGMTP